MYTGWESLRDCEHACKNSAPSEHRLLRSEKGLPNPRGSSTNVKPFGIWYLERIAPLFGNLDPGSRPKSTSSSTPTPELHVNHVLNSLRVLPHQPRADRVQGLGFVVYFGILPQMMENHMEKQMEHKTETGVI